MTVQKYVSISDFVFQQDNCGPHMAKSVTSFLVGNNINVMKWLAESLDLNPMEYARAVLKRQIRERPDYPRNADHLFEILQNEWNAIPDYYFTGLITSMESRATIVKSNKGGSTKYRQRYSKIEFQLNFHGSLNIEILFPLIGSAKYLDFWPTQLYCMLMNGNLEPLIHYCCGSEREELHRYYCIISLEPYKNISLNAEYLYMLLHQSPFNFHKMFRQDQ